MKFLISGASSAFAKEIAKRLTKHGAEVTLMGRDTKPSFNLENPSANLSEFFNNHDIFLHFAHSFEFQENPDLNEKSAMEILRIIDNPGIRLKKCIYISSDSANAKAISEYGKSKFRSERIFLNSEKCVVLRIGIVLDEAVPSAYQMLKKIVKISRILFLPNPNKEIFRTHTLDGITEGLLYISQRDISGGPYTVNTEDARKSVATILHEDNVKYWRLLDLPVYVTKLLIFFGKRIRVLRRFSDSIQTTFIELEEIQGLK